MTRDRWFVVLSVTAGVLLSLTLSHQWPQQSPAELSGLVYPDEIRAGEEIAITGRIEEHRESSDCIVGASLMVQMGGRLSFTRWTATRSTADDEVSYLIPVPKNARTGPARIFIRESYFCEDRSRVAFVNGSDMPALVVAPADDLRKSDS